MKKILILTYYLPPYTGIEGHRANSWANNFYKHSLFPIVICRHWNHIPKNWSEYQLEDQAPIKSSQEKEKKIIYIPYLHKKFFKILSKTKLPFLLSGYYLWNRIIGNFHIELDTFYSYWHIACDEIENAKVDAIIITSPPINLIKLGYKLSKKFQIPLIVDLRDSYDTNIFKTGYKSSLKRKSINIFYKLYFKKWLLKAKIITTISKPFANMLASLLKKEVLVVTNGFEENLFNNVMSDKFIGQFVIAFIGTIYPEQDIEFVLNGLKEFIKDKSPYKVKIVFIGAKNNKAIAQRIQTQISDEYLFITNKIERNEALTYTLSAQVLLHIGWKGYKGIYSGKIFEYLGARRNILIAPSDHDVLEYLIEETNAGKTVDTIAQMVAALNQWYKEWEITGKLGYEGIESKIQQYTREEQANIFAKAINDLFDNNKRDRA